MRGHRKQHDWVNMLVWLLVPYLFTGMSSFKVQTTYKYKDSYLSCKLHQVIVTQLTTSDFSEKTPSVKTPRASHFTGNLTA